MKKDIIITIGILIIIVEIITILNFIIPEKNQKNSNNNIKETYSIYYTDKKTIKFTRNDITSIITNEDINILETIIRNSNFNKILDRIEDSNFDKSTKKELMKKIIKDDTKCYGKEVKEVLREI